MRDCENMSVMKRFGKFISLYLEYKRIRKRFGKFVRMKEFGCKGKGYYSLSRK